MCKNTGEIAVRPSSATAGYKMGNQENLWIIQYLCTKGLNVVKLGDKRFIIVDVFGNASIPFIAEGQVDLGREIFARAKARPLLHGNRSLVRSPTVQLDTEIPYKIEEIYVARLPDLYRIWLCGSGDWKLFDMYRNVLPTFYHDYGFGDGSKSDFDKAHTLILQLIDEGNYPFEKDVLYAHLMRVQLGRICDDIVALIHRASKALQTILLIQRQAIKENAKDLEALSTQEILHVGPLSFQIASHFTVACIALCTSLDLAAKLIWFINENLVPPSKFRPAQGKHFDELRLIKARALPSDVIAEIQKTWEPQKSIKELIQFRHDLVHSTTALEIERKLYIGLGGDELRNLPLHYSYQPWRDTDESGQPHRLLGRDYFTSQNVDIEWALYAWLNAIIDGHIDAGTRLLQFFEAARATPAHKLSGT